jgi:hypothetical protein
MKRIVTGLAVSSALLVVAAAAAGGGYSVKIELPAQWAHAQAGMIKLVGVAPPKAPYTSSLVLYAARRDCLASGWTFLNKQDDSYEGYVVGAGVASKFTYIDGNKVLPPAAGDHLCAYVMNVVTHATVARASLTWK